MKKLYVYGLFLVPQFVLSVFNVLLISILVIPFLAQPIHNTFGGFLYFYIDDITLGISVLIACILTFLVYQKIYRKNQMFILCSLQMVVLLCCFLIYYINMHELSQMMNKPTYE